MILLHRYVIRTNWILGLCLGIAVIRKPHKYWNRRRWISIGGWEVIMHLLVLDVKIGRLVEVQ